MKKLILAIVFGVSFLGFVACTSGTKESSDTVDSTSIESAPAPEMESTPSETAPADTTGVEADTTSNM